MQDCTRKSCILVRNKRKRTCKNTGSCGADDQIRTGDLILTKDALYRLSYISACPFVQRKMNYTT